MAKPVNTLFREWSGPLTADLIREPGRFGLGQVPSRLAPDAVSRVVCGFCSTGCGLLAHQKNGETVNLSPDPVYPVNLGMACPKGWEALAPLGADDRLLTPRLRNTRETSFQTVDWHTAMTEFVGRFKEILQKHGPESIAFLSSGQISTEEIALLGALYRFGMGGVHGDSNTRQCMATSHVAYKQSLGFDAPPYTYADFEESDVLVFFGSNLCIAHPILWQRVLRNPHKPEIVVVDPRRTETAMNATRHLAIHPKSDLYLLYGVARALVERGAVDRGFIRDHTSGFEEFSRFVAPFTQELVCAKTGLNAEQFERFVSTIAEGQRVSFWWTMGVNQGHESTRTAQAIINLALMTGNIGRPGTGANSITGQCNAMGSRLFANTGSLPAGRDFENPRHREEVAGLLGLPLESIPTVRALAYDQILDRIKSGGIKALWVIGTNPFHSWIDQKGLSEILGGLEFLVVQDLYSTTETARMAHLLLPAAGWGEKEGTFINSERRLSVHKKLSRAPGDALADFSIFQLVAHYWGCGEQFAEWKSPAAAFQILKRLSAGTPCDFSGIENYKHIEESGGIQWPCVPSNPDSASEQIPSKERRLFSDGRFFTPDQRARFLYDLPRALPEPTDEEFPFALLTGRGTSAQWHTLTRTSKSAVLNRLAPEVCQVDVHPSDAAVLGIRAGDTVRIRSRRAEVLVEARLQSTVSRGTCFLPMHFTQTNQLTLCVVDPHSRQPSYKHCAVRLERVE